MAAGDLALQITITATSDATPIIEQVAAAVDQLQATLDAVGSGATGIEALDAAFATLDTEIAALSGSLDQFPVGIDAAITAFDTFNTALTTVEQQLGLIPGEGDAAAQGLSSAGIGAEQASAAMDSLDTALAALYQGLGLVPPEADVGAASLAALGTTAQQVGTYIAEDGTYMDAFAQTFNGIVAGADSATGALDTQSLALQAAGRAAGDYAMMTASMTGGMEAAIAGMTGLDDAVAMESVVLTDSSGAAVALGTAMYNLGFSVDTCDAAMTTLDSIISTVGGAFGLLGTEADAASTGLASEAVTADAAAAATRGAGEAGSMAGFQLMMLAGMLLMAGSGFVSMGTSAQDDIAKIAGLADQSMAGAAGLDKLNATVTQLEGVSLQLGVTLDAAAQGMYYIISAGFSAADSLTIMKNAMEASKAMGTDFTGVANGLTSILRAYNLTAADAARVTNMYVEAVVQGKQAPADFARAIGALAASAHSAGLTLQEMFAAEATLTQINPRVRQDAQNLSHLFDELATKSDTLAAHARSLGGGLTDVQFAALPLIDRLKYLAQVAGGDTIAAFKKMGLDATGARLAFELLADGGKHYAAILQQETHSQDALSTAFKQSETTISAGAAHMNAALSVLAYQFVTLVSPILAPALHAVGDAFHWLATHGDAAKAVMLILAGAIGGLLVGAIIMLVIWLGGAVTAVGWVAMAIGALVGAFIYFYTTSAQVRSVVNQIIDVLKQVWAVIVQVAVALVGQIGPATSATVGFFRQLWAVLQQGWATIQTVIAFLVQLGTTIYNAVAPFVNSLISVLRSQFIPVWQTLQASFAQLAPLAGQLGAVFNQLAAVFMSQLMPSLRVTWQWLQQVWTIIGPFLLPALQALGIIIGAVLVVSLGLLIGVLTAVTGALAMFLRGAIAVVTGVIQVFTGFAQIITGIVSLISDIIMGRWGKLAADTAMIWLGIQNVIAGVLNIIVGIVTGTFGVILAIIDGFVQGVIGFFTSLYHALVGGSIVPDMCNAIIRWFTNLNLLALQLVSQLATGVVNSFLNMGAQAIQAVTGMVNSVIGWFGGMFNTIVGHSIMNDMQSGVTTQFRLMDKNASDSSQKMSATVQGNFSTMQSSALSSVQTLSAGAIAAFQKLGIDVGTAMSNMDASAISYWNKVADYLTTGSQKTTQLVGAQARLMQKNVDSSDQMMSQNTQTTMADMLQKVPATFGVMATNVNTAMQNLATDINTQFTTMKTTGVSTIDSMKTELEKSFSDLQTVSTASVITLGTNLNQHFGTMRDDAVRAVTTLTTNVNQQFNTLQLGVSMYVSIMESGVVQQFQTMSSTSTSTVTSMVSKIDGLFSSMQALIATVMAAISANVNGVFSQIAGSSYGYGSAMMSNFIAGANSQMGALAATMAHAAGIVASYMPHSPAEKGPLAKLDTFMPGMIKTLTQGIDAGVPTIAASMRHLVQPIAAPLSAPGSAFGGGRYPAGGGNTTIVIQLPAPVRSPVYLDKKEVGYSVMDYAAKEIRRGGGFRNR